MTVTRNSSLEDMMSRLVALALLTMLVVALQPGEASACSCAPVETGEMVERADYVFVGQEVARATVNDDIWPPVAVTFEVVEAYKGSIGSEITVWTGRGDGDCGVGPSSGLIGITAYVDGERALIDSCGSVHPPEAIAAVADPIDIIESANPPPPAESGSSALLWVGAGAVAALLGGLLLRSRRRDDYQDGWNSGA